MEYFGHSNVRVRKHYFQCQVGSLRQKSQFAQNFLFDLILILILIFFLFFYFLVFFPGKKDMWHNFLQERQDSNLMEILMVKKEDDLN